MDHDWCLLIEHHQGDVYLIHKCNGCGTRFPYFYDPRDSNFDWDSFCVSSDCDIQILKRILNS